MFYRFVIVFIVLILLAGCSASGPVYKQHELQNSKNATLYIYRPSKAVNCCVAPLIYVDSEKLGPLKNGGYTVQELEPGAHVITVGDGSHGFDASTVELNFESGEEYYLKWVIGSLDNLGVVILTGMVGAGAAAPGERDYNLVVINSEDAKVEISKLKMSLP
ncbi:DUF2846 domain-containing protein [Saccharophagus degradans]|nr:DUF2846 domain-containing protein [Saccharophagus degradans]